MNLRLIAAASVAAVVLGAGSASAQHGGHYSHGGHGYVVPSYAPSVHGGYSFGYTSPGFGFGYASPGHYVTPAFGHGYSHGSGYGHSYSPAFGHGGHGYGGHGYGGHSRGRH